MNGNKFLHYNWLIRLHRKSSKKKVNFSISLNIHLFQSYTKAIHLEILFKKNCCRWNNIIEIEIIINLYKTNTSIQLCVKKITKTIFSRNMVALATNLIYAWTIYILIEIRLTTMCEMKTINLMEKVDKLVF